MKVELETGAPATRRLSSLNILQINARSLVNFERRHKLANAIQTGAYNIVCVCETWLNEQINDSELFLSNFNIYRQDRKHQFTNTHGGALIAVKNTLSSHRLKTKEVDSCVLCKVKIEGVEIYICSFYNPPKTSPYR